METTTRNATLEELADMLKHQNTRKLDVIAPATAMRAEQGSIVLQGTEAEVTDDGVTPTEGTYRPTDVFEEQASHKLGVPVAYLRKLRTSRPSLWDANINGWLHGSSVDHIPADARSFLVRTFRGDDGGPGIARALLSDRYGIADNLDVLVAALGGVRRAGVNVDVDGCDLSDRRMYVRVVAPQVAELAPELLQGYRSPFTGQTGAENPTVFAGFVITNSETGGGAFQLIPRLVVQVCNNGMTMSSDAVRGIHLGSRMQDGVVRWSRETERRTLDLVTSRTRDAVATFLATDYVRGKLQELTDKAARPVEDASQTVEVVSKRLQFNREQQETVLDYFIKGGQLTAGGLMHAVTASAQTVSSPEAAHEMETAAPRVLDLVATGTVRAEVDRLASADKDRLVTTG